MVKFGTIVITLITHSMDIYHDFTSSFPLSIFFEFRGWSVFHSPICHPRKLSLFLSLSFLLPEIIWMCEILKRLQLVIFSDLEVQRHQRRTSWRCHLNLPESDCFPACIQQLNRLPRRAAPRLRADGLYLCAAPRSPPRLPNQDGHRRGTPVPAGRVNADERPPCRQRASRPKRTKKPMRQQSSRFAPDLTGGVRPPARRARARTCTDV